MSRIIVGTTGWGPGAALWHTAGVRTPPVQLDIFADSAAVVLRNDVLTALVQRDPCVARTAWHALAEAAPGDPHLPCLQALIDALEAASDLPLTDADEFARERSALAGPLTAAACEALGAEAGHGWLRPAWRRLAERAAGMPFQPSHPEAHAAAAWLQAGDAARAAEAAETIESWRRIPAPLGWVAEARARAAGLDAAWPLLTELAWLAPRRLGDVLERLSDPLLDRLRTRFDAAFEGAGDATDLAWFPAWLLTATPALAPQLAQAQPSNHTPAEQSMRLLLDLLALERQGRHHDLVRRRQTLRDLDESLYAIYMSTR